MQGAALAYFDDHTVITDAAGSTSEVWFDTEGRTTRTVDANGAEIAYEYDENSNITAITDALGNSTRYSYDKTGNTLSADYAGEQTETNTYNELGLLTTVTTAQGDTLYQYDDASRLISVTQPNGDTVNYTYDSHGNRSSMTYPNGKTVSYSYDEMNRLVSVKGVDGETTKYSYDALGRRISTDGVKEDTVYAYDEVGNLTSQTTTGAYDLALEYAYDLSGRMTSESRTENGATLTSSFTYDALGQLTSFTRSDGQSESYAYDPVGNMTAKTQNGVSTAMRYNAANQLVSSVSGTDKTTYSYDANGNLTRSENAAGARSYAYNALNLLESFTREDGYTENYSYNANRLLSEIRTSEDLTTTLTWDILYGDGVVISAAQNGQTTNYTYGLERISAITGRTRTEYVYDGRGSVAAEVSYNNAWYTFGGGLAKKNVTAKSYTPFGEQIGEVTGGFGYNGEYYNAATGMIYLRARFYEPEMNRFGQKDTLRGNIADGISLNRYLYCQSDPVNFADYNGLQMVNVCVADGGGGYSFRNSQTYQNYLAEGRRLVNEAQQNAQQAKVAWQRAEAYAPGSSFARQALNSWNQAKEAAHTASTNLSRLQNASTASGAGAYLANIRQAAGTARNEKYNAQLYADRASNYGVNSTGSGITVDAPSVQDPTGNGQYSCGEDINTLGEGDNGTSWLGTTWNKIVGWVKSDEGQKTLMIAASTVEIIAGVALIATGAGSGVGARLIAVGASSLIGGYLNERRGGSFFAGWVGGGAAGLISSFGFSAAGALYNAASISNTTGAVLQYGLSAFASSGLGAGAGAFASNAIVQRIDTGEVNWEHAANNGLITGAFSSLLTPLAPLASAFHDVLPAAEAAISTVVEFLGDTFSGIASQKADDYLVRVGA